MFSLCLCGFLQVLRLLQSKNTSVRWMDFSKFRKKLRILWHVHAHGCVCTCRPFPASSCLIDQNLLQWISGEWSHTPKHFGIGSVHKSLNAKWLNQLPKYCQHISVFINVAWINELLSGQSLINRKVWNVQPAASHEPSPEKQSSGVSVYMFIIVLSFCR